MERASDFAAIQPYQGWGQGVIERACPNCGHRGPTYQFQTVRERHQAGYAGGTAVYP